MHQPAVPQQSAHCVAALQAHINAAKAAAQSGKLLLAGAFGSPPEGATFIWKWVPRPYAAVAPRGARGSSAACRNMPDSEIQAWVAADPYIKNQLVTSHELKPLAIAAKSYKD